MRRLLQPNVMFRMMLGLVVSVMLSATSQAASDHSAAASGHSETAKGGLSFLQLERYDLGIYTLVVFGLLILILRKFAWPKITEGLKKREESIAGARDDAHRALKEAEELRLKLKEDMAKAQEEVRAILEEARRDAEVLRQKEREAGIRDAQAERERAKREIEAATDAALKQISQQAIDLAAMMSTKALSRQITIEDHHRLLDESLAELSHLSKPSA